MKILVIDDEPLVRRSLARAIRARGHESIEAVDGTEGLRFWLERQPDAVFVDVLMPGLSGPDVVRRAHEQSFSLGKNPVIVLISAFSGEDSEKLALECGAESFVAKPFEDIFVIVDEIIEKVMRRSHSGKGTDGK